MSMEQWWNVTDRGKLKYWEKTQAQIHVNHTHKCNFHVPVNTTTKTNQFREGSIRYRDIGNT